MKFCEALDLPRGITAVIGSGGKTSLLMRLAEEVPGTAICELVEISRRGDFTEADIEERTERIIAAFVDWLGELGLLRE